MHHHNLTSANYHIILNTAAAQGTGTYQWNDTLPTSTVFSVGSGSDTNGSSDTYVAYCFAPKQGFSKFGSYLGNNNADGTFIYTGFKPAFLMVKCSSHASSNWVILDNKRSSSGGGNPNDKWQYANTTDDEVDQSSNPTDFLSNGIKMRNNGGYLNASGRTYIYIAFAESTICQFKWST